MAKNGNTTTEDEVLTLPAAAPAAVAEPEVHVATEEEAAEVAEALDLLRKTREKKAKAKRKKAKAKRKAKKAKKKSGGLITGRNAIVGGGLLATAAGAYYLFGDHGADDEESSEG